MVELNEHVGLRNFDEGADSLTLPITMHFSKAGRIVTAHIPAGGVTAVTDLLGALAIVPPEFRPASIVYFPISVIENFTAQVGMFTVNQDGDIGFLQNIAGDAPLDANEEFSWLGFSASWIAAS